MLKQYERADAADAIRRALDGTKVFESSTQLSSPDVVAAIIRHTADEQGIEVVLRMAPKGVLIAHAERSAS
jgi:hypothetical protein